MARPLRILQAGGWYHVTVRGNERKLIYRNDRDRVHFVGLLGEMVGMFGVRLHAFVLMDNHFHLLLELSELNLSKAVQWLNISYSVWFNHRHSRAGHLFQGRFKSIAIDPATWAVGMSIYIHLNPVRIRKLGLGKTERKTSRVVGKQGIDREQIKKRVERLRSYRWSSCRAYLGKVKAPDWLTTETILSKGPAKNPAGWYRQETERQVREGLPESPWEQVVGQAVLGSAEFIEAFRSALAGKEKGREIVRSKGLQKRQDLQVIIRAVEAVKKDRWSKFRDKHGDWGRDMVIWLARKRCGMPLRDIGEAMGGMDYAAVSNAARLMGRRLQNDQRMARNLHQIENKINLLNI